MYLVWSDELNNPDISSASWNLEQGDGCPNFYGLGNNEVEFCQTKNASVVDATLVIESRRENSVNRDLICCRKTTKGKRFFKFGCINIRAHGAYSQSIWPALWMLPQEEKFGGWPRSGEFGIMEIVGHEPSKVHTTIHHGPGPNSIQITRSRSNPTTISDQFHVYSLILENNRLRFLLDYVVYPDIRRADLGSNNDTVNEFTFFIFNVAFGGNWPESPKAITYFPQWMIVDYVRVFL
jgi:beta-glucanase (GH16 family)